MNEIIKIDEREGKKSVRARELYKSLGLDRSQVSRWLLSNILQNDFAIEHEDYEGFDIEVEGNGVRDYALSIDFAKKICMLSKTKKGEEIRNYFIECEKELKMILPKTFSEALRLAADQAEQIEIMKPKALVYDSFLSAENWMTGNEAAKVLNIGRNKMYHILRETNIWMENNTPYQQYMNYGYFKVIEKPVEMAGKTINKPQTLISAKGLEYIKKVIK